MESKFDIESVKQNVPKAVIEDTATFSTKDTHHVIHNCRNSRLSLGHRPVHRYHHWWSGSRPAGYSNHRDSVPIDHRAQGRIRPGNEDYKASVADKPSCTCARSVLQRRQPSRPTHASRSARRSSPLTHRTGYSTLPLNSKTWRRFTKCIASLRPKVSTSWAQLKAPRHTDWLHKKIGSPD